MQLGHSSSCSVFTGETWCWERIIWNRRVIMWSRSFCSGWKARMDSKHICYEWKIYQDEDTLKSLFMILSEADKICLQPISDGVGRNICANSFSIWHQTAVTFRSRRTGVQYDIESQWKDHVFYIWAHCHISESSMSGRTVHAGYNSCAKIL